MARHKAVIVGAGRIGAAYQWADDSYSHAGAYLALKDRVELVGFVELDVERGEAAFKKWGVPWAMTIDYFKDFDIVSVCTPEENHAQSFIEAINACGENLKGLWMEKPFDVSGEFPFPFAVQVNYLRRADEFHRLISQGQNNKYKLIVYGKDDESTRCHFRDLSRFWNVPLDYRVYDGPCAYMLHAPIDGFTSFFDNGGINPGECMKGMLANLLDAVEGKAELWSPPYVENA